MSTTQFKKSTTHLDFIGRIYVFYQHVVKTCPFCNSIKSRLERSRVSGLRAKEFGDLIFFNHGSAKMETKSSDVWLFSDGVTSHLTVNPCKSTSTSEVIAKLHECMDTFQMNPKTICVDMTLLNPRDMQTLYRMHNVKRIPTGHIHHGRTEQRWVQDCSRSFSWHSWTPLQRIWTRPLWHRSPAQLMRKATTRKNTQRTSRGKRPMFLTKGRRPRDLLIQLQWIQIPYIHTNRAGLLNEEIQRLTMRTHLEVQQREDIRRDLAERMKFEPPDLRAEHNVLYWQEDPSKIQQELNPGKLI